MNNSARPFPFVAITIALAAALAVTAGCQQSTPTDDVSEPMSEEGGEDAPSSDMVADSAPPKESVGTPGEDESRFDPASVPVSTAALGAFPYFSLPSGYTPLSTPDPVKDLDRVPFWTGDRMEWVEGRVYQSSIAAEDGKAFSQFEVQKNIGRLVESVGGVQVTYSRIPQEVLAELEDSYTVAYVDGKGDIYNERVQTYLIRRDDRNIWVHLCVDSMGGGWIIAETAPFQQTAALLPADELKQQLDADGKVALQVNFATDRAEILPESQPQIEQVLALLQAHPDLKLSINGHTDDSGDAAHNQQLSEARAAAVAAALTEEGIDPSRLQTQGFGQSEPVADNATEAGKAKNRRVELVRI